MNETEARVDLVGQTLMGKLRVVRLLGEGGMGAVYEVEHLITRHHRALKVMHRRFADSTETVSRFIREAGVAGTLKTPHVVETYDAGQLEDGSPYVLMEMLSGTTFAALVDSGVQLSPGRVVGIVCQVLEGLAVAHDAGIVHRDIKPDNVFVSVDERGRERVRILDFGISKFASGERNSFTGAGFDGTLTSDHTIMGTPYYMSPEQATGAKLVDERSDLYSLGVMLYEGLAGVRPFDAQNMAQLIIKIHAGEYPPLLQVAPHVSPALAAIVERAMHHDAGARYGSARELQAVLLPHAESNYTSSLQTLREVPSEGPIAAMPVPRRVDIAAHTLAAPDTTPDVGPKPRAWLVPSLSVALVLAVAAGVFAATRGPSEAVETPVTHERPTTATGSEVTGPAEVTGPETGPAEVTGPEVTEPEVTAPEVTGPAEVTAPEVTAPEVTAPEVIEPVAHASDRPRVRRPREAEAPDEEPVEAEPTGGRRGTKILRDVY